MPGHWLCKTEPGVYSIDDLRRDTVTGWEGVRNYQARNFMRDGMAPGDRVLFYRSNADPAGVAGVAEVSVVGRPDPEWGEAAVAFVVARSPAPTAAELDAHCLAAIARFKRPKEYRFVEDLPKNNYGKVLKTELRARLES